MRAILFTVLTLAFVPLLAAAEPVPTVIVDIHALGADNVQTLKQSEGVAWSAEFGNEMLLGVTPASLPRWLAEKRIRPGPAALAFDEVVVRDHACTLHDHEAAIAIVGGYEILRMEPLLAKATRGAAIAGEPLPADGVVAHEVHNRHVAKGAAPPVAEVQQLLAGIDRDRWYDTMAGLAAFNRNSFNPALPMAKDWILQRFAETGLATQSYTYLLTAPACAPSPPTITAYNPIAIKPGETLPDEWIVVGAHYDSRNTALCETSSNPPPQPGANDNASGCAGVIELARAFATQRTARTILFMCFSGEEQGLRGSRSYVTSLQTSGEISRVKHMLNLDMIGHAIDDNLSARAESSSAQVAMLNLYAAAAATYAPELNLILAPATQANSDHWYFLDAGVPSVFTWENGASGIYPQYHTSSDIPANMQRARPLAHGILKMDAAVLADRAILITPMFADGFED